MGHSTVADKVIGILLLLCGGCGVLISVGGTAVSQVQPNVTLDSGVLAFTAATGALSIAGGIGMLLAAKWGHMAAVVAMALSIVLAIKGYMVQTAASHAAVGSAYAQGYGFGAAAGSALRVLVALSIGAYCVWRLASDNS